MISKIIRFLWSLNHAITLGRSLKIFFYIETDKLRVEKRKKEEKEKKNTSHKLDRPHALYVIRFFFLPL